MITAATLTFDTTSVDATSFNTASVAPGSNKLELFSICAAGTAPITDPTITGNSLTWTKLGGYDFTSAGRVLYTYLAQGGSPSSGAITIDFGAQTIQSICWCLDEFSGTDTGAGVIVQGDLAPANNSGTSVTVTLSAFASSSNAAYGVLGKGDSLSTTPGAGFTELTDQQQINPTIALMTEWTINDPSVDASWTSNATYGMFAFEIAAGAEAAVIPVAAHGTGMGYW